MKNARADVAPGSIAHPRGSVVADYVALTKPRLNLLVVLTSAAGYYLGAIGTPNLWQMAQAVVGTALVQIIADRLDAHGKPGPDTVKAAHEFVRRLSSAVRDARQPEPAGS